MRLLLDTHSFVWFIEVRRAGMTGLAITLRHAVIAGALAGDHRDPFDRILSAQSLCDNLIFISNDEILDRFGISRIW